ncbi:MAG: HEAT repeat domain-containing protein [Verrucomicrobia bacterium]|nr:HEAT repeat domain-containing protein [Verrucomicrobiota bacterium]
MKHASLALGTFLLFGLAQAGFGAQAATDAAALDQAFVRLSSYDWSDSREALGAIEQAVIEAHGDSARRQELEKRLAVVLTTSAPRAAKDFACRQLSVIGTAQSVPALAALLLDPELSHVARLALERIPGDASAAALREALPKAEGNTKVGIINSLGVLADPQAASLLAKLLADSDPAIASAATSALGKIGTLEATRALERFRAVAPPTLQPLVNEACIEAAENLVRRGARAEAARLFRSLYSDKSNESLRLAGFRGLLLAEPEPEPAIALVARALASDDASLRNLAGRILAEPPGERVLDPFLRLLPSLPPAGQVALLGAIHAKPHASARSAVLAACDSRESSVRLAALRALGLMGNAEDVPRLARLAATGTSDESATARLALANLPGREVSSAMLAQLLDAQPSIRIELMKALAARFATEAASPLANQLKDANDSVRSAALEALGVLGDAQQAPTVIAFLKSASDDDARGNAEQTLEALVTRAGGNAREALLSGLKDATASPRIVLLQQLGRLGGRQALEAVRAELRSDDAQVRDAAFRVLTAWPDAEAAPDLLKFAQQADPPSRRALAFRGYVRLCREAPMSPTERLAQLSEAAKLAADTDEKVLMVSALADVPEPGALKLLAAYLDDAALVDTASLAAVKVASALEAKHKDTVAPVLQQVLKVCKNADVQRRAREVLTKLGAQRE